MKTKTQVLELIDHNGGKWTPNPEISFTLHGTNDFTATFTGGPILHCFGDIKDHIYISISQGPLDDAKYLLKYCGYMEIDTSSIQDMKPVEIVKDKVDEISSAKLSVYEKIFDKASKITIDNK